MMVVLFPWMIRSLSDGVRKDELFLSALKLRRE